MSQDGQDQDLMGYETLAQEALRGVVKAALKRAAGPGGLPGGHHFYVTFKTRAAGVSIPPELVEKYPDEMTIVIQHQFWDLAPGETFFSVTLRFGGQPKRLSMPYQAVTRFYDPSVQFLLQFEAPEAEAPPAPTEFLPVRQRPEPIPDAEPPEEPDPKPEGDGPKVVSLDKFRKK
jgi:uncharacterized protein